jgi:Fe-S oxidoreductase
MARVADGPTRILVHGHCHQKALGGLPALKKLLSRIPDCEIIDADAGCCGMAGSFGYETEHYEVSRAAGERKLLPAIRGEGANAVVVAPGFSCRQQIAHFTQARAVSAIELIFPMVQSSGLPLPSGKEAPPPGAGEDGGYDVD